MKVIKLLLYKVLQKAVNIMAGHLIKAKKISGTELSLYYEISQHLGFLFGNEIHYEDKIKRKLNKYIAPNSLVFDVGSNIGQYALWFVSMLGDDGRLVCYEPDSKNYAFLKFNILANNCSNVVTNNIGLSDKPSQKTLFYRDTKTGGRSGSMGEEYVGASYEGVSQYIETTTLDLELGKYGVPGFVKIDVEGLECAVLRGLKTPPKDTVFFVEVRENSMKDVFDYFNDNGFSCLLLDTEPSKEIKKASEIPGFSNLLFYARQ